MVKVLEDALGGEYTVTVNPYPSTTAAMKATMDGNAEIGYTADVGMAEVYTGTGSFKDYKPAKSKMVHTWYAYPMESFMAVYAPKAGQFKSWGDFSGKPVFFTPAGFMNWLNFIRIYQGARLPVQTRPDRRGGPGRRASGRHHRRRCLLYDRRPVASVLLA